MKLNEIFQQAVTHHHAGRFAEAEELYRSVLQVEPKHPDANHNLGLMAMQLNQAEKGLPYLQAAWEADPSTGEYWLTLTECLLETGHPEDALLLIEDAIRRGMDSPQAQQLLRRAKDSHDSGAQPADTAVEEVLALFRSARFPEAEERTRSLVETYPNWAWGWKLLGAAMQNQGKNGMEAMRRAVELNPNDAEVHNNLGVLLQAQGRLEAALASLRRALELKPDYANAHNSLGSILDDLGQFEAAQASYRRALELNPDFADAHNNMGVALKDQGQFAAAAASLRRAIELKPDYAEAHNNLGIVLNAQGQFDAAQASCRRALELNPNYAEAHYSLGCVLNEQGQFDAARASYCRALELNPDYADAHYSLGVVLNAQGQLDAARASYRRALELNPGHAEAHYNLGLALRNQGQLAAAAESLRRAIEVKPDYADAHNNLSIILNDLGQLDDAQASCRRALELDPHNAVTHNSLGVILRRLGQLDAAQASFRMALEIDPGLANAHSNLLFCLSHSQEIDAQTLFAEHCRFGKQFEAPMRAHWLPHNNSRNPDRRLRIGYVSPDFRNHAVAYFVEPILANHDKLQVEIFCYAEVEHEDDYTARIRQLADHWHSTVGLSDDAVAQMIRGHQIDILVDLAGHTASNRLPVFARKPAPVQVTYLGYPGTTGLSAMNYRITDHHADPEGVADAYYTERLLRLPDSLCCYRPTTDMPETSPLPALSRGYLTFGSFNSFSKIDQPTVALWAELLRALPASRLMMLTVPEGEIRLRLTQRFAALGIDAQRLEFHGKLPAAKFHRKFLEVDIALDTVSVSGGTTTCESLWMGVPVIAFVGKRFITRVSYSFLNTAGFADFAAASPEDYIIIASHLADNLPLLADIRAGLRDHLRASPLVDEAGFTSNLENLYRDIWGQWCGAT
ncbi:MAG: tetratricopeptide repeat protein [Gallionella sp.]|nr:tetratricopeptide repeat protein [Gallionella sp.]